MISPYSRLTHAVEPLIQSDTILDCAIGSKTIGVHTHAGTGLTYVTREVLDKISHTGPAQLEQSFIGMPLSEIVPRYLEDDPLVTCIALASINSVLIHKGEDDPQTWFAGLRGKRRLGMVGYFCPIMDRIALTGIEPIIFELRDMPGTYPPEQAPDLLPTCDAVLITGATFANKTIHHYIPHISPEADAFIFGHTTPLADFLLDTFTLGSTEVMDKEPAFACIRQNGSIRDIKQYTRKVILRKKA